MVEDCPRDDEGLLQKYDVVVCGTGLVQSILASALARAGKSVLHCDSKDYYGELDAVLTLPYIQHGEVWEDQGEKVLDEDPLTVPKSRLMLHSTRTIDSIPIEVGTRLDTPYGSAVVQELAVPGKLSISLNTWTLANGLSPTLHIGIPDGVDLQSYLLDNCKIRPSVLVQTEKLLQEQSRSFAIDVTPSLIFGSGAAVLGFLMSNVSEYVEFKSIEGMLWLDSKGDLSRVPCSKGDVFGTKLLNPLEKRKLMKFLQLVMDYATSIQATEEEEVSATEEVQSLNERQLNQGRSLSRPQNKAVKTGDLETLTAAVEANEMNFEAYLTETQKLSKSLKSLVRHALALDTGVASGTIGDGMRRLCQHLQGLGKFGKTAFLVPLYGSGEFPQAFCRSAAVHGGTYLLRREPKRVVLGDDNNVTGVVISGAEDNSEDKTVVCDHVVIPPRVSTNEPSKRLLRRVSVVSGKIVRDSNDQRHIILIPPHSDLENEYAIHGIILDSSVNVAPPNCTLVHLTTTVDGEIDEAVMEGAVKALLSEEAHELYHVSFSYELSNSSSTGKSISGLHIAERIGQTFAADDAFVAAQKVFESICPDVDFLALSEKMDNTIKENLVGREEEDEERDVLDKAAGMLDEQEGEEEATPDLTETKQGKQNSAQKPQRASLAQD